MFTLFELISIFGAVMALLDYFSINRKIDSHLHPFFYDVLKESYKLIAHPIIADGRELVSDFENVLSAFVYTFVVFFSFLVLMRPIEIGHGPIVEFLSYVLTIALVYFIWMAYTHIITRFMMYLYLTIGAAYRRLLSFRFISIFILTLISPVLGIFWLYQFVNFLILVIVMAPIYAFFHICSIPRKGFVSTFGLILAIIPPAFSFLT